MICGELPYFLQKEDLNIMFPSLISILVIIGFILWRFVLIFWVFIIPFKPLSKLNILLLLSVLGVIFVGNIFSMYYVNYLFHMELVTTLLVLTLQKKMVLLKGNIGTLLKMLIFFYCLHVFLLNSWGNQFFLQFT